MLLKILKNTLLLLLVAACIREKEVIIGNSTTLVINIQDEWDAPLNAEVNVYLFESPTDHQVALTNTDPSKNLNGKIKFDVKTYGVQKH